ncbi:MAG: GntR family transcriptional regulator [Deltaproteobacteria bacterium]|nr:GntR family transcriptional regulator [Deltaproteobacteria bacterium]
MTKSKKVIVYEYLKKKIIAGVLKPGEPLVEGVLARELKTSKTPIREAMQQLEKEGFVEIFPGKGAFVSRMSFQDIREIFEIREILECEVIRRVAAKGDFTREEAEAISRKFVSAESEGGKNNRSHFKAGEKIHNFVFEAFGNKRLIDFYSRFQEHIERLRLVYFANQDRSERSDQSFKEHLEILNALIAKDPARAEKAMRDHLQNSTAFLKEIA